MADRVKASERENRELRQANEIFRKASAYFAMISGSAALLQHCLRCSTAGRSDGGLH
jgi:transposase-like protein